MTCAATFSWGAVMRFVDPYQCFLEQRYDRIVFVIGWGERPALDDPADYDSIDIEKIIERYFELAREPELQQWFATNAVLRMRRAVMTKKRVLQSAVQILDLETLK